MDERNELLRRIAALEAENSVLRDKLDLIYSIVAPEDEVAEDIDDAEEEPTEGLVQIRKIN